MIYDPLIKYTAADFLVLSPTELQVLFESARKVVLEVGGRKLIKKVSGDISTMRRLLNGYDCNYNREHRCLKSSR